MGDPVLGGAVICRPAPITLRPGGTQGFTLLSDLHLGAPQTDYRLITTELDSAAESGDRILINGDVFDAVLAKDVRRFEPDCLHPRLHGRKDILNASLEWAVELLSPYAHFIDMVGCGNHETAVERHHNFDLTAALVRELNSTLSNRRQIHHGGYTGFVDYRLHSGNHKSRFVIWYHHGSGRGTALSGAANDFSRRLWVEGADVMWMGHRHSRLTAHIQRLSCPRTGKKPKTTETRFVMTGAYFDTYRGQTQTSIRRNGRRSNYAADAGMQPFGKGGARVEVKLAKDTAAFSLRVSQ